MSRLLPAIRAVLAELLDRIDTGRCATTEEQEQRFLDVLMIFANKENMVNKYSACKYLNISRSKFDSLIREGKIPKGKKEAGWKELSWNIKDLDFCKL